MQPNYKPIGVRPQGLHQGGTGHASGSQAVPHNYSPAYPLQSPPAYQQAGSSAAGASLASPAVHQTSATSGLQYQAEGTQAAWQGPAAQQPSQHALPHQPPTQLVYSSAPQSAYAQQQRQQYPSLHHAHIQNAGTGRAVVPAPPTTYPSHQPGAVMQTAPPAAAQHAQAAGMPAAASTGRGFTHNQLNVLRNQILAFRRIKVSQTSGLLLPSSALLHHFVELHNAGL